MRKLVLCSLVLAACYPSLGLAEDIFTEFEGIYLAVFVDTLHDLQDRESAVTVAMSIKEDGKPVRLPDGLWRRLIASAKSKSHNLPNLVAADKVVFDKQTSQFLHRSSRKRVRVFAVDRIEWHGGRRIIVSIVESPGVLTGNAWTCVLKKTKNEWTVVEKKDELLSQMEDRRDGGRLVSTRPSPPLTRNHPSIHRFNAASLPKVAQSQGDRDKYLRMDAVVGEQMIKYECRGHLVRDKTSGTVAT